jgi:hypothetical protein
MCRSSFDVVVATFCDDLCDPMRDEIVVLASLGLPLFTHAAFVGFMVVRLRRIFSEEDQFMRSGTKKSKSLFEFGSGHIFWIYGFERTKYPATVF